MADVMVDKIAKARENFLQLRYIIRPKKNTVKETINFLFKTK